MATALQSALAFAPASAERWNLNALRRFLLGVTILDTSIQIDTYLLYQEGWAKFGAIGGINISLATISLAMLYGLWLLEIVAAAGSGRCWRLHINLPLTAYFSIVTLSWFAASEKLLAISGIVLLFQAYLIYTYVANQIKTRSDVAFVMSLLAVSLAFQGAVMIGLRIVGHGITFGPVAGMISDEGRVGGTIGSPVTGGSFLALMFAPTLAILATPLRSSYKKLATIALGLGGIGLLLTQTRGSWIAVAMSVTLFFLLARRRNWISLKLPIAMAFIGLLMVVVFRDSLSNRFLGDDENSAHSRIPLYQMAWAVITDNPLSGVGINNCAVAAEQYSTRPQFRGEWFYTIHNKYLLEWVETGFFGLATFVLFLLTTIHKGWGVWQRRDHLLSPIALALLLAIAGQMVHMTVDVFSTRPQVQSLWLCAGLIAALGRIEENG